MIIIKIAINDLLKLSRDKMALVFMFVIPIIFSLIMSFAFANIDDFIRDERIFIGITDYDKSNTVSEIIKLFEKDDMIKLSILDENDMRDKISKGIINAGFIFPNGYENELKRGNLPIVDTISTSKTARYYGSLEKMRDAVLVVYIMNNESGFTGQNNIESLQNGANLKKRIEDSMAKADKISVEMQGYQLISKKYDYKEKAGLGYIALFVMFSVVFGARVILDERQEGTWEKIATSPINMATVYAGKILGIFIKSWIQCLFLIIFLRIVLKLQIRDVFSSFLILNTYILCIISIMMFISTVSKTNAQYNNVTNIVVLGMSMLAGCWWPIEVVPYIMQKTALLLPPYWMISALSDTLRSGFTIWEAVLPITVLSVTGIVFLILSLIFNRLQRLKT